MNTTRCAAEYWPPILDLASCGAHTGLYTSVTYFGYHLEPSYPIYGIRILGKSWQNNCKPAMSSLSRVSAWPGLARSKFSFDAKNH